MKHLNKKIIFGTAILSILGTSASANQVLVLKNGDRISGQVIKSQASEMMTFKTAYGATFNIPMAQVMAVQSDKSKPVEVTEPVDNITDIKPAAGEEIVDPNTYEWSGRANLGASLTEGNSNKKAFTGDAEVAGRNEKNRWIAGLDANFANDEGTETENDQSVYAEYNRFINEKWFYGARQEFKVDKIANLDLRSKTGPFVGYQFYEQDDLNLKVRMGANYIFEEFQSGDREEDIAAAWALNYDQTFMDGSFTFFHDHELDVPVDPASAFLFQSKTGVRVPVAQYLTGTAQIDFDWDNEPTNGIDEQDTKYSVKLGYEW